MVFDVYAPESRVAGCLAQQRYTDGHFEKCRIPSRVTPPNFPMMELTYRPPVVRLVETESISSGVWTHPNLDQPDVFWVFRAPASASEEIDGGRGDEDEGDDVSDVSSDAGGAADEAAPSGEDRRDDDNEEEEEEEDGAADY